MIRVIVVDDDPFVGVSLETILNAQEDMEVVAKGTSGPEAVALYDEHVPDVLLMDIQMAGGDGLSAAEQVIAKHPGARVVFLTTFADDDYIARALHLGSKGYLIKQNVTDIAPAVRAVAAGQNVLGDEVVGHIARTPDNGGGAPAAESFAKLGGGSRRARRAGSRQPRDSRPALHGRGHRAQPHQQHPPEAPAQEPHADRRHVLPHVGARAAGPARRALARARVGRDFSSDGNSREIALKQPLPTIA